MKVTTHPLALHEPFNGTLRFVESDDDYSTYVDRDGNEVYLGHGTGNVLCDLDEVDLQDWWRNWISSPEGNRYNAYLFVEHLKAWTIDPDRVDDEVGFCVDCNVPDDADDQYSTQNGSVCETCYDDYIGCGDCEEQIKLRDTTGTLHDEEVCRPCLDRHYHWCDYCDGWYHQDAGCDGDHYDEDEDGGCDCESPQQSFSIRNDGNPALANDTRVTVTLPAGIISDEGIGEIASYLRQQAYYLDEREEQVKVRQVANSLAELGNAWQTKQGNFTKRLSRMAYKDHAVKISPQWMSQVGTIASNHSTAIDFQIETTRDLNLSAAEFAHEDSCWWQSYYASRCTLKSNGGFGLRTFGPDTGWNPSGVTGRAWVMPLKVTPTGTLTPTFETLKSDAYIVFNGYGDLSDYAPARLLAHMTGMTYRKVGLECSPVYINSDAGYLVAPEIIAAPYTDGRLSLSVDDHADLFNLESANAKEMSHV